MRRLTVVVVVEVEEVVVVVEVDVAVVEVAVPHASQPPIIAMRSIADSRLRFLWTSSLSDTDLLPQETQEWRRASAAGAPAPRGPMGGGGRRRRANGGRPGGIIGRRRPPLTCCLCW